MFSFWTYGLAAAAGLIMPPDQAQTKRRAGHFCYFWPESAPAAERKARRFEISWVMPDDKMTGHQPRDMEILQAPKQIGAHPRVVDVQFTGRGSNVLLEGDGGRGVVTMVPNEGHDEYQAGFSSMTDKRVPFLGACKTILADETFIAQLRQRNRN